MPEPHERVGDYEIIRELGHGGMGQVYLVRNVISDRVEAMKVLLPDLAQQGDLANRFMREIKVLASLDHPNIAVLRTAFTANNQLVMIMEYVEGDTLAHRLERGAFTTPDSVNYIGQVLSALSYAHSKGIIHRDIKPANMMLTPHDVVKLMDFGIARSNSDLGMTVTGATVGSLDYMSPEQVKAEPTDARSDLYSVGVSLYEMQTGRRMFSATSSFSVMEAHVKEMPRPPIELLPTMPKALSDIIMMAVAKDPGQRFQTAEAFRNALSQVTGSLAVAATAAATPHPQTMVTPPPAPYTPQNATPHPATMLMPTPTPAPHAYGTPTPAGYSAPTPAPYGTTPPQAARGGRHVGWLLAVGILVLVAVFGGAEVYLHKPEATGASNEHPANPTPTPVRPAPAPIGGTSASASVTVNPPAKPNPEQQPVPKATQLAKVSPPPALPPAPAGPSAEELAAQKKVLDEMESETDKLEGRAAAVESSVGTLEQQMHQSGLGLRGDMVTARSNMRNDLAKAKQAMDNSDIDRARKYLDQADHEIQKLEAFTGR